MAGVPFHALETYLAQSRPALTGKRSVPFLFVGATAEPPTRQQFWALVKRYAAAAGIALQVGAAEAAVTQALAALREAS